MRTREQSPSDPLEWSMGTHMMMVSSAKMHIMSSVGGLMVSVSTPVIFVIFTSMSFRGSLGRHNTWGCYNFF